MYLSLSKTAILRGKSKEFRELLNKKADRTLWHSTPKLTCLM